MLLTFCKHGGPSYGYSFLLLCWGGGWNSASSPSHFALSEWAEVLRISQKAWQVTSHPKIAEDDWERGWVELVAGCITRKKLLSSSFFFFFHFSRGIERKTQHCSFPVSGETSRDLTTRQRRRQWKCRWKIDFTSSETFSILYQVSQLPERREVRSELMRGDRVRVQTKIVKFSASPFQFSCQLKIWSFHVVVVQERRGNEQKSAMHVQSCCFAHETRWALDVPVAIAVVVS